MVEDGEDKAGCKLENEKIQFFQDTPSVTYSSSFKQDRYINGYGQQILGKT